MSPTLAIITGRALTMGEQLSQMAHLSKRSSQTYEEWQIVLIVLFPSLIAVGLAAYCIYQRVLLHRLYDEKKQTHPLLREREFTKMGRLSRAARLDNEELERSIMIRKSLASRSSFASTTRESSGIGTSGARSTRCVPNLAITTTDHDQLQEREQQQQQQNSDAGNRPWTANSRNVGSAPPSPLSQVISFPAQDQESVSPMLPPPVASPRSVLFPRMSSSDSMRDARDADTVNHDTLSPTGSRRSSLSGRPKLASPDAYDVSQPRPPFCVY